MASLFYILFTHRKQALHDRLFRTVVLRLTRGARVSAGASLDVGDAPDPALPSARRRFAAFLAWAVAAQVAVGIVVASVEIAVLGVDAAERPPESSDAIGGLASLVATLALAHLGASGRLPGARRTRVADDL